MKRGDKVLYVGKSRYCKSGFYRIWHTQGSSIYLVNETEYQIRKRGDYCYSGYWALKRFCICADKLTKEEIIKLFITDRIQKSLAKNLYKKVKNNESLYCTGD